MKRVLPVLCLLLGACSGTTIGAPCTVNGDCQNGEVCLAAAPGGYCAKGCTIEGDLRACPVGSICASQLGGLYCSLVCSGGGCRAGYQCLPVGNASPSACKTLQ